MHWVSKRRAATSKEIREQKARLDLEIAKANLELVQGKAEAQAIANQQVMKDLIPMDEARDLFLKTISDIMAQLDNAHGRLAPIVATMDDPNDCADAIKDEIRRIRENVVDIIAEG